MQSKRNYAAAMAEQQASKVAALNNFSSAIAGMISERRFNTSIHNKNNANTKAQYERFREQNGGKLKMFDREYDMPDYDVLIDRRMELLQQYNDIKTAVQDAISKPHKFSVSFPGINSMFNKILNEDYYLIASADFIKKYKRVNNQTHCDFLDAFDNYRQLFRSVEPGMAEAKR